MSDMCISFAIPHLISLQKRWDLEYEISEQMKTFHILKTKFSFHGALRNYVVSTNFNQVNNFSFV